jgi:SAM-dependent methyltransferase
MKYPEEYVVRFFFKRRLNELHGTVLEVGCGNGSNLMLFGEHDWNVVGIDISATALADAKANFSLVEMPSSTVRLVEHDLTTGLPDSLGGPFDGILFPNSLYYLPRRSAVRVLSEARALAKDGAFFYLRMRTLRDYRRGRGDQIERNGYRLTIRETGEWNAIDVFYREYELVDLLRQHLGADGEALTVLHIDYENVQNDTLVCNSDIVIWGSIQS